jgi:DNA-binding response OmpR family regulator
VAREPLGGDATAGGGGDRPRVLVVGEDRLLLGLARRALSPDRYVLTSVRTVDEALDALFAHRPDLVLVTSRPDGEDGATACRELQAVDDVPVVLLSPDDDTAGVVRGLTCADDYVALPVAPEEVEARVRAVLRRAGGSGRRTDPVYDDGRLRLDFRERTAALGGGPLSLTPTEHRLLALFAANPRRLFTHDELLRRVWGSAYAGDSHLLRLHVANLRRKIERPGGHRYLRTHRGLGYAFEPPGPAPLQEP